MYRQAGQCLLALLVQGRFIEVSNGLAPTHDFGDGLPDHAHFEIETPKGRTFMVQGDPDMSGRVRELLGRAADAIWDQYGLKHMRTKWRG